MSLPHVYLKQNVLAEPLFNQWYAWPGLIAPASAAMFIANSHLKIMQSFVSAPQVHIAALKNPSMRGAPFIHYDANRVSEIKALIEKTSRRFRRAMKTRRERLRTCIKSFRLIAQ